MAHDDCKHDWNSFLTRKLPQPPGSSVGEGKIKIREVNGKLKGSHADSTSPFEVTCSGNKTKISFTRVDNKNKKRIEYKGNFTSDNSIHGTYIRTDIVSLRSGSAKKALSGDSGDWDATKPPTLLKSQARAAKGAAKSAKKRSGTAAKKSSKKQARKKA